jgi:hypothetical protein
LNFLWLTWKRINVLARRPVGGWYLAYKFRDVHRQYEGGRFAKQLVKRFDAGKPQRTNIMKPAVTLRMNPNDGPRYIINYGVLCNCEYNEIPYFGEGDDSPYDVSEISI